MVALYNSKLSEVGNIMYQTKLNLKETEIAIKKVKDTFETYLARTLQLMRVSAPLFVSKSSGLNDNLNGTESPVSFVSKSVGEEEIEIVHSLAKWKRMALLHYGFHNGEGLYTDMNAIRKDEIVDHLHSIYVDQWDWEKLITKDERTRLYLELIVRSIVHALYLTQEEVIKDFSQLDSYVIDDVYFITTKELETKFPNLPPKEREREIARLHKVVFIIGIGWPLANGLPHDGRAPDYDDWNLNGDLLIYHPVLNEAIEVSSMGIRVDAKSLQAQLKHKNAEERLAYKYHQMIMTGDLPLTIGGGIGQSRICLLLLNKVHIGEVQASLWSENEIEKCKKENINLL